MQLFSAMGLSGGSGCVTKAHAKVQSMAAKVAKGNDCMTKEVKLMRTITNQLVPARFCSQCVTKLASPYGMTGQWPSHGQESEAYKVSPM